MNKAKKLNLREGKNIPEIFTDLVQITISNDVVRVKIASKKDERKDEIDADIKGTIVMTIGHFLKVSEIFQEASYKIQNELSNSKRKD